MSAQVIEVEEEVAEKQTLSSTEVQRRYRAKPEHRDRERAMQRCRARALTRLAENHQDEFTELYREERAREDQDLVEFRKPGRPRGPMVKDEE